MLLPSTGSLAKRREAGGNSASWFDQLGSLRTSTGGFEQPAHSQHLLAALCSVLSQPQESLPDTFHSQSPREARIRLELKAGKHAPRLGSSYWRQRYPHTGAEKGGGGCRAPGGSTLAARLAGDTGCADPETDPPGSYPLKLAQRARARERGRAQPGAPRGVAGVSPAARATESNLGGAEPP